MMNGTVFLIWIQCKYCALALLVQLPYNFEINVYPCEIIGRNSLVFVSFKLHMMAFSSYERPHKTECAVLDEQQEFLHFSSKTSLRLAECSLRLP